MAQLEGKAAATLASTHGGQQYGASVSLIPYSNGRFLVALIVMPFSALPMSSKRKS
jgi:hypothetical protein